MSDCPDYALIQGDARRLPLADRSVQCVVTSPPFWGQRDYAVRGQIGHEPTPGKFVAALVGVFREIRRVLADDGIAWLNLGDTYQCARGQSGGIDPKQPARRHGLRPNDRSIPGLKPKNLIGVPWRVALALQDDGWFLRSDIIWHKPNSLPESVRDRPEMSHEHVFLLAKKRRYFYDHEATRDKRSVWSIPVSRYPEAHFATFPPALVEPCVLAGCPVGGLVFDPFSGSGTTGEVALRLGRRYVGTELSRPYLGLAANRIANSLRPISKLDPPKTLVPLPGQLDLFALTEAS